MTWTRQREARRDSGLLVTAESVTIQQPRGAASLGPSAAHHRLEADTLPCIPCFGEAADVRQPPGQLPGRRLYCHAPANATPGIGSEESLVRPIKGLERQSNLPSLVNTVPGYRAGRQNTFQLESITAHLSLFNQVLSVFRVRRGSDRSASHPPPRIIASTSHTPWAWPKRHMHLLHARDDLTGTH